MPGWYAVDERSPAPHPGEDERKADQIAHELAERGVLMLHISNEYLDAGAAGLVPLGTTGEGVLLRDVVAQLAAMARVDVRIEVDPSRLRPADTPWLVGDPSLAERETGWKVTRPFEQTLADVLEEWRGR